jgi:hypothetical protein
MSKGRGKKYLKRRKPHRLPNKLVLILCEGAKTEPHYFNGIRRKKRISSAHVAVIPGNICGTDPANIVNYAKEEKRRRARYLDYDEVWCVFDRDEHHNIAEAFDNAKRNNIKVAFTNPCFELWLLLHFADQRGHIERNQLIRQLKKHIPDYDKSMQNCHDLVCHSEDIAVSRAEEIRDWHIGNNNPETHNPSTSVDRLVRSINSILPP